MSTFYVLKPVPRSFFCLSIMIKKYALLISVALTLILQLLLEVLMSCFLYCIIDNYKRCLERIHWMAFERHGETV